MKFSEFAQALAPFYKGEMTIPKFTKELLKQITSDEDAVLKLKKGYRSDKTFTSYYTDERQIRPIAKALKDKPLASEKFVSFLKQRGYNASDLDKLCKTFKNYLPDKEINDATVFDVITKEYIRIITSFVESEIESSVQVTTYKIPADSSTEIKLLFSKLKDVINKLIKSGRKIESRNSQKPWDFSEPKKLNSDFDYEYDLLQEIYDSLDEYNKEHSNEQFDKALQLIALISKESFIEPREQFVITSRSNWPVKDLLSLIEKYLPD